MALRSDEFCARVRIVMMRLQTKAIHAVALLSLVSASAAAAQSSLPFGIQLTDATSEVSIGLLNGRAQAFSYVPATGATARATEWRTRNAAMFNTQSSVKVLPWLALNLTGSTNITGNAEMEMSQFGVAGCPALTCQTKGDSTLVHANRMELFAAAQLVQANGITLNALAGYKRDFSKWQAFGGTRNFGAPPALPAGLNTSYEQTWSTPYLGLAAAYKSGAWTINGRVIGSAWATGEDRTQDHLGSTDTVGKFGKSTFVGADLQAAYRLNASTSVTAGYGYQNWGLAKGTATVTGNTGVVTTSNDAAGANNVSHMLSLGMKIDLNTPGAASNGRDIARALPWTGWYAGVTSGPDWLRAKWETKSLGVPATALNASTANQSLDDTGARLGGLAGYTWQTGAWVWGVEADLSRSTASATKAGIPGVHSIAAQPLSSDAAIVSSGWDGSLRLRAGTELLPNLFPNLLIYGTGGIAFQQTSAEISCPGASGVNTWCGANRDEKISQVRAGLTAGLGYEKQFAGNWFTRGEYRYTTTGGADHTFFASAPADTVSTKIDTSSHRINFGLGYRF